MNDSEVSIYTNHIYNSYSLTAEKDALMELSKDKNFFVIVDSENDEAIGSLSLMNVNLMQRKAELGIVIGDKNYWSKGYGSEAILLLLDHAFNVLNMNSIMLLVSSLNKRAIKCYEKCGFKEFGRRRMDNIFAGKRYDTVYMDILTDDFKQPSFVDDLINQYPYFINKENPGAKND